MIAYAQVKPMHRSKMGFDRCPFCGKLIEDMIFDGAFSLHEFYISGLCQECQNDFFGQQKNPPTQGADPI